MQQVLQNFQGWGLFDDFIGYSLDLPIINSLYSSALKGFQKAGVVYWLKVFDFSQGIRCWRCDRLETRVRFGVE